MSKINEQIERLRGLIRKCYATVAGKNGTVPEMGERNMENLPAAIASTHDTLEELTITQNGEYTPQEGVDGFSKVVAEFDTSSLPKVKVSSLSVTDSCINDEGRWDGERLIDTTNVTSLNAALFYNNKAIKMFDGSEWNLGKCTSLRQTFNNCENIEFIDMHNADVTSVTNMHYTFKSCNKVKTINTSGWVTGKLTSVEHMCANDSNLEYIDVSGFNVSNTNNFSYCFGGCLKLQNLNLVNWDMSNATNVNYMFYQCKELKSIIGNETINDVIANNIGALNGLKVALSLNNTILDRASLRAVINGLADLTGQTAQTLTLGATLMAKLTEEDIAITTSKNWTIA